MFHQILYMFMFLLFFFFTDFAAFYCSIRAPYRCSCDTHLFLPVPFVAMDMSPSWYAHWSCGSLHRSTVIHPFSAPAPLHCTMGTGRGVSLPCPAYPWVRHAPPPKVVEVCVWMVLWRAHYHWCEFHGQLYLCSQACSHLTQRCHKRPKQAAITFWVAKAIQV